MNARDTRGISGHTNYPQLAHSPASEVESGRRFMYDCHTHTYLCKHAVGMPGEYAAEAEQKGLKGLAVTCHAPLPVEWAGGYQMDPDQLDLYVDTVMQARNRWEGRVDIILGLECDYAPELVPWLEKVYAAYPFQYLLGSVHPWTDQYRSRYFTGDKRELQRLYFKHLAEAARTGLFHALSHPDVVKHVFPNDWDVLTLMDDIRRCLDEIAACGVALELNTPGILKNNPEMNPGLPMLKEARLRSIPIILGSDAHTPSRVGDCFEDALALLLEAGYDDVSYFKDGRRETVTLMRRQGAAGL